MPEMTTICSLWFWRKGEDGPEMLTAWDTWTVDGNQEGWTEECKRVYEEVASDDSGGGPREINFLVDYEAITAAFYPTDIEASVSFQDRDPASDPHEDERLAPGYGVKSVLDEINKRREA